MIQADFDTFTSELTRLSEYYEKSMSEGQVALYFESLSVYAVSEVVAAMRQHVRMPDQGRFWPKVADFVSLIEGDVESVALQAWTTAVRAWEQHGVFQSVQFADPCLAATIEDMGGWIAFDERHNTVKEEPFMRQEFVKRYRGYRRRPPIGSKTHLPGIHELENGRNGYRAWIPTPRLVGAPERRALQHGEQKALVGEQEPSS